MNATLQHVIDEIREVRASVSYGLNAEATAEEDLIQELEKSTGRPRKEWTRADWGIRDEARAHRAQP